MTNIRYVISINISGYVAPEDKGMLGELGSGALNMVKNLWSSSSSSSLSLSSSSLSSLSSSSMMVNDWEVHFICSGSRACSCWSWSLHRLDFANNLLLFFIWSQIRDYFENQALLLLIARTICNFSKSDLISSSKCKNNPLEFLWYCHPRFFDMRMEIPQEAAQWCYFLQDVIRKEIYRWNWSGNNTMMGLGALAAADKFDHMDDKEVNHN